MKIDEWMLIGMGVLVLFSCIATGYLVMRNRQLEEENHELRLQNRRLRVKCGEATYMDHLMESVSGIGKAFGDSFFAGLNNKKEVSNAEQ